MIPVRRLSPLLAGAVCAIAFAACGNSESKTSVEASTAADQRLADAIQAELKAYDVGFDLESMPQQQADQLAPVVDNLPQAAGGVQILRVDGDDVEATTDFPDDEEGSVTGRLICGAIERAAGKQDVDARVLGKDDAVLAECSPADADYP
jgi:hypothetical protein